MGTGDPMTVTTCPAAVICSGQADADYDSEIIVYSGSCTFGVIEEARDMTNGCSDERSTVRWCTQAGIEYLILVTGWFQEGHFTLELCAESASCAPPPNNECANAITAIPGFLYEGFTVGATPADLDGIVEACPTAPDSEAGAVWYQVVGNDLEITASTCVTQTDFKTRLRVIGFCTQGIAQCIATSNQSMPYDPLCDPLGFGTNTSATVTWCGEAGEDYFIVVDGPFDAEGNFGIYLTEGEICRGPGACCLDDGGCVDDTTLFECRDILDGFFMGSGTQCAGLDCLGTCCLLDGTCEDGHSLNSCTAANGAELLAAYRGPSTDCATQDCLFLISPDGLWTSQVGDGVETSGIVFDLFRNDLGPLDHLPSMFFTDLNDAPGGGSTDLTIWEVVDGPVIDPDRSHSWAQFEELEMLYEVRLEIENFMISGPAGGVLVVIRATNDHPEDPVGLQLYAFANVNVNGTSQDYDATPIFDPDTQAFVAAAFTDEGGPGSQPVVWVSTPPTGGNWEIGYRGACSDVPCQINGLNCDILCGIQGLGDVDGTAPGGGDHGVALSTEFVTLGPFESMELRFGIGGEGFSTFDDPCPGDIDGDGEVGITDFLALLAAWGPNRGHPADIDGDGEVGILDFLEILADWGPCI
jgi:hypothetical protein